MPIYRLSDYYSSGVFFTFGYNFIRFALPTLVTLRFLKLAFGFRLDTFSSILLLISAIFGHFFEFIYIRSKFCSTDIHLLYHVKGQLSFF